ncbi:unnamed protein product [Prorocentrum cordatum]|nr:unnamed protein product [Polarella glacialis]
MIMKYFDNVVKCFGGSLILYTTTLTSMLLFGSKVDAAFILGLLVYSISSYFYAGDHIGKLSTYERYADEIEALVRTKERGAAEMARLKAAEAAAAEVEAAATIGKRASGGDEDARTP